MSSLSFHGVFSFSGGKQPPERSRGLSSFQYRSLAHTTFPSCTIVLLRVGNQQCKMQNPEPKWQHGTSVSRFKVSSQRIIAAFKLQRFRNSQLCILPSPMCTPYRKIQPLVNHNIAPGGRPHYHVTFRLSTGAVSSCKIELTIIV